MWPPQSAPSVAPPPAPESPEQLALFNQNGLVGVSQPYGRAAMRFAGRETWMVGGCRSEHNAGTALDRAQRRHLDELHGTQLALELMRQQDGQRKQAA